ncbi:MAG: glycosyltransferase family 2 protein [Prolixibacteraceae bacterium]|nr:glycosyltransferase family 2 protein [Prolixibacteraceae bacterium]
MTTEISHIEGVSVIMPTYNQASFISLAINSLIQQNHRKWEVIIINDGCTDNTDEVVSHFLSDRRFFYYRNANNLGLGKCLNIGISKAKYNYIAYLPSDDIIFPEHLSSLLSAFKNNQAGILAFSGIIQANYNVMGTTEILHKRNIRGHDLQLVQVLHKKNTCKWMERDECTTNDYSRMYWNKILDMGAFIPTNQITCEWVEHPNQRNKKIQQGINIYRSYYNVKTPLKFHPKNSGLIDEVALYSRFLKKTQMFKGQLKILIVGELSFNPERILAFEEAGHKLFGLWAENCWWFHTVGPLPFGNVTEVSKENWKEEIELIKPDIIYGLLSALAAPTIEKVIRAFPCIPFVWHFKEGPFYARQNGLWSSIQYLFEQADGIIHINEDIRQFYNLSFPKTKDTCYMVLDGELPKADWFIDKRKPLLSQTIGGYHTVIPGRPLGLTPEHIEKLAKDNIHLHLYGENWHHTYNHFIQLSMELAPNHIHLHPACDQRNWAEEFSQYDAGWLHFFESKNGGDYLRAKWEDYNIPARMATLAVAGLPMLQRDNTGHIVATQTICKELGNGIFITEIGELIHVFNDRKFYQKIRNNSSKHIMDFAFDTYVPKLIGFFKKVIANSKIQ